MVLVGVILFMLFLAAFYLTQSNAPGGVFLFHVHHQMQVIVPNHIYFQGFAIP